MARRKVATGVEGMIQSDAASVAGTYAAMAACRRATGKRFPAICWRNTGKSRCRVSVPCGRMFGICASRSVSYLFGVLEDRQ